MLWMQWDYTRDIFGPSVFCKNWVCRANLPSGRFSLQNLFTLSRKLDSLTPTVVFANDIICIKNHF